MPAAQRFLSFVRALVSTFRATGFWFKLHYLERKKSANGSLAPAGKSPPVSLKESCGDPGRAVGPTLAGLFKPGSPTNMSSGPRFVHFEPMGEAYDVVQAIKWITDVVGAEPWLKRAQAIQSQIAAEPELSEHLRSRYEMELEFQQVHLDRVSTGELLWPPRRPGQYRLFVFLCMLHRLYPQLTEAAQHALARKLYGGLKDEAGLAPLAFEFDAATQLMGSGFSLYLNDYEEKGGVEFLARKGELEVEVECKYVSVDRGRKIPRKASLKLCAALNDALRRTPDFEGLRKITILMKDRLGVQQKMLTTLAETFRAMVTDGTRLVESADWSMSVEVIERTAGTSLEEQLDQMLEEARQDSRRRASLDGQGRAEFRMANQNTNDTAGVLISIRSARPDQDADQILSPLNDSTKHQFSTKRPGIIFVHLADASDDELSSLFSGGDKAGFHRFATELLQKRSFLHTIAFTSTVRPPSWRPRALSSSVLDSSAKLPRDEGGRLMYIPNPDHPLADNADLRMLFEAPGPTSQSRAD